MPTRHNSDQDCLRLEREADDLPLSRSPFGDGFVNNEGDEVEEEPEEGELRVKSPEEVPWVDLLLEIAMTTAFASLTDGTPILQWDDALSYVLYFAFVWWIWVAQVAYNMRFRQADWLHRIWVFAQLIVFSALAAFTKDFDIKIGLSNSSYSVAQVDQLRSELGYDQSHLAATNYRDQRLPRLNARGLSMVMAMSRLVLLLQYGVVFYHARRITAKRTSILVHMVPLLFSSLCYLAAFVVLGSGEDTLLPSRATSLTKLFLWYSPILIELASHYVALLLPGFVRYSTESVYARSGTVFLIILGAGLDKITGGFKSIIGNAGMGRDGIPLFVAAAVIFIGYFSLYFATPGSTRRLGNKRALTWFFSQFFFLSALIVTLQGIATSLSFTNLNAAITRNSNAVDPLFESIAMNPGVNLTASDFNSSGLLFRKLGLSLDDIVDGLNTYVTWAEQLNNSDIITSGELQLEMALIDVLLTTLDAKPDPESLLAAKLDLFLSTVPTNTTEINRANFFDIYDSIIKNRGSSVLWFYPAAGSTILALVLMSFAKGLPRDKWEWKIIMSRLFVGSGVLLLGFLGLGASNPTFDSEGRKTNCLIWRVALSEHQWLLIVLAGVMGTLQTMERLIVYNANRSYRSSSSNIITLNGHQRRRTRRHAGAHNKYEGKATELATIPSTVVEFPYSDQKLPGSVYSFESYELRSMEKTLYSPSIRGRRI